MDILGTLEDWEVYTPEKSEDTIEYDVENPTYQRASAIAKRERKKGLRARIIKVGGDQYGVFIDGKRMIKVKIPKVKKRKRVRRPPEVPPPVAPPIPPPTPSPKVIKEVVKELEEGEEKKIAEDIRRELEKIA